MTESTATLPNEQIPAAPEPEPAGTAAPASRRSWSPVAAVIWALFAVGTILFVAFARVPLEAGWRNGRSMRVLDIWRLFTLDLAQVAGPLVTPALATALVLVVLGGSLLALWLAMAVTNDNTVERPD